MYSRADCQRHIGSYVSFRSPYGYHEGVIERVSGDKIILLSPRRFIPTQLAAAHLEDDAEKRLDLVLAWGGYGRGFGGGYGGGYGYGWGRWAVSFLVIYALFGLWW